jgi:hypothetical protein
MGNTFFDFPYSQLDFLHLFLHLLGWSMLSLFEMALKPARDFRTDWSTRTGLRAKMTYSPRLIHLVVQLEKAGQVRIVFPGQVRI